MLNFSLQGTVAVIGTPNTRIIAGTSINWSAAVSRGAVAQREVTLSGSGRKAGVGKTAAAATSPKSMPSLCKAAMLQRWHALRAALRNDAAGCGAGLASESSADCEAAEGPSYGAAKKAAGGGRYARCWAALRQDPSPLSCWVPKPRQHELFTA